MVSVTAEQTVGCGLAQSVSFLNSEYGVVELLTWC